MSLQKIGVIPDKFILLKTSDSKICAKIEKRMIETRTKFIGHELIEQAKKGLEEYNLHIEGVKSVYKDFIYEIDGSEQH